MSSELHSTTQANEQPQNPGPSPEGENPQDLRSRPNDARNDHKAAETGVDDAQYPPQLHAGKVGLGPHFGEQNRPTFGERVHGVKEMLEGKLMGDEHRQQEGYERFTGELKRKEHRKENPFGKPAGMEQPQGTNDKEASPTAQKMPLSTPASAPGSK